MFVEDLLEAVEVVDLEASIKDFRVVEDDNRYDACFTVILIWKLITARTQC